MSKSKVAGRVNIPEFKTDKPSGVNWLLVIAIDEYVNRPLNNCVRDVKAFVEIVTQRYNIEQQHIIPLFDEDATADNIYQAFENLLDKVQEHDNLIVYYSGHGDYHGRLKEGYWIPFDAETRAKHIANDTLKRYLREIRTRHTLIICDSCFSGTFAVKSASDDYSPEALVQRYQDASRWVITSGSKQEVLDGASGGHSPFAEALLAKMRAHTGDLSARALGDAVISDLAAKKIYQKPLSEAFDKEDHQGGLFVFFQKQNEIQLWNTTQATDTAAAYHAFYQKHPESSHAEEALWQYACKNNQPTDYQLYRKEYPKGKYRHEVFNKIDDATFANATTLKQLQNYLQIFGEDANHAAEAEQLIDERFSGIHFKPPAPPQRSSNDVITPSDDIIPDSCLPFEPEMIFVQGGKFKMGSDKDDNAKPVHDVTIRDFYIGKYPVTFAEYDAYCEATNIEKPSDQKWGRDRRPVINVNWEDAKAYCDWLSKKTNKKYRLPTEAEWEFAARGGNKSGGYEYAGSNNLDEVGWFLGNSGDKRLSVEWNYDKISKNNCKTHPVGEKKPNELDIYDMSGNVWEWCEDVWHDNYEGTPQDGSAWMIGGEQARRVVRGGSWYLVDYGCPVSNRFRLGPDARNDYVGFRLARY